MSGPVRLRPGDMTPTDMCSGDFYSIQAHRAEEERKQAEAWTLRAPPTRQRDPPLIEAVREGDEAKVQQLLSSTPNLLDEPDQVPPNCTLRCSGTLRSTVPLRLRPKQAMWVWWICC